VPLTCNINSELESTVATSTIFTDRRGEHNIPKRYLKEAEWYEEGYLGAGYYTTDPYSENTTGITAVDLLRHGRDVHLTWVTFTMTGTLRVWTVVLCESTKFEENLVSF
jgi:hypothetical protein